MGCIASMLDLARLTDECLTLDILQLLGKSGVDKLILECPAEPDLWDQEGASPMFCDLKESLMGHFHLDEPLKKFTE